ncbi:MAG: amidohydrolase [Deltaproteobacteria bacterium]|nr:amidohydrolase [Deltaproteobacteria bacterium]
MAGESKTVGRIDVHAHYLPPGYRETAMAALKGVPDGMPRMPDWDPETTIAMMDRQGIATAMLSVSSPGVHFGNDDAARGLARSVNEFAARNVQDHHGRFGLFASLPLPNIDAALEEISYAFDVLKVDGFIMLTNLGGIYLGNAKFDPIFDELNRRSAVVFIHPTSPPCWEHIALGFPRPMIEFPLDSTRAVTNLAMSGTLERCPNIQLIVPHAGGTLPFLARRIAAVTSLTNPEGQRGPSSGFIAALQQLFYDTAGSSGDNAISSLLTLVDSSRILYGSDYPFTPETVVEAMIKELNSSHLLNADDRRAIEHGNAMTLFARSRARRRFCPDRVLRG